MGPFTYMMWSAFGSKYVGTGVFGQFVLDGFKGILMFALPAPLCHLTEANLVVLPIV